MSTEAERNELSARVIRSCGVTLNQTCHLGLTPSTALARVGLALSTCAAISTNDGPYLSLAAVALLGLLVALNKKSERASA